MHQAYVKLNVDGSRKSVKGCLSAGGILRAAAGVWIAGFTVNIGVGSVLNAELWGLFHGLTLAWRLGYRKVHVELDSAVAVTLIMDFNSFMHPLAHLITICRELLRRDCICLVSHVYREKNRVADGMADLSHKFDIGLHVFYEPPPLVDRLIFEDAVGFPHNRFVNS
ncbi:hypothetical protein DVH24_004189 [Malus domestica]|uniref:RNase H type-1 domain-containing protein n=1 Tax=Malus domestica TaxID=3750 RepID=A0A498K8D9_MALDO|nr:hypothetical protein DVH24_004189 [Malus domestica]